MLARVILALALSLVVSGAVAQRGERERGERPDGGDRRMSQEERQRMRDDMRDAYRNRQDRPQKTRQPMSPEQREQLRRDIQDANRNLKR
jgi:hypothetical protein